jgi:periplasmic protein TonB
MERIARRNSVSAAAANRVALALLASIALHVLLLTRIDISGPEEERDRNTISARIDLGSAPVQKQSPDPKPAERLHLPPKTAEPGETLDQPADPVVDAPSQALPQATEPAATSGAIEAPIDLTYYAARELDVYPAPFEPLRPRRDSPSAPPGWVRLLVMIDETGTVAATELVDADPLGTYEETALQTVRSARFSAGRREGRVVRSRILLEFRFDGSPS